MTVLKAEKRSKDVKAGKLRREGYVTGNIYGRNLKESVMIQMDRKEAGQVLRTGGKGRRILLEVDGEPCQVLIKEVDYDFLKKQVNDIGFQTLVQGEKIQTAAKVVPLNQENVTEGAFQLLLTEIAYKAYPDVLVERAEFDAGSLRPGDAVKVKDLEIAKDQNVELAVDPESVVAVVSEVRRSSQEEKEEPEEERQEDKTKNQQET